MRRTAFLTTLFVGLGLAIAGFVLAAPIGPTAGPEYSNPRVIFAPGIFVIGVVTMFASAVVFELLPTIKGK